MKDNPCWKGYEAIGTKNKKGKEVPNCVPLKEEEVTDYFSGADGIKNAYILYKEEYTKLGATQGLWDYDEFEGKVRRYDWKFYGDENGYVAIRPQRSGLYKLMITAGSMKSKLKGFKDIISLNLPLWGAVSANVVKALRADRPDSPFRRPTPEEVSQMEDKYMSAIENMMGGKAEYIGDASFKIHGYSGEFGTKYFVANNSYYNKMLPKKPVNIPIESKQLVNLYAESINYLYGI